MDFNELKNLARKLGGILVMNGNSPEFVILPFDKYQAQSPTKTGANDDNQSEDSAAIEKLNKEIQALKEEIRQKEEMEMTEEIEGSGTGSEEEKDPENAGNTEELTEGVDR